MPGERLAVRVVAIERGYARAVAESRLGDAAGSRDAPCAAFPECGGCAYQSLDYSAQLELKTGLLRESLGRAGIAWAGEIPATGSPEAAWRTRATFHVSVTGGALALGYFAEGTRRVVDLQDGCPQVSPELREVLLAARGILAERPAVARRVAHLRVAESSDGSERVVLLEGDLGVAEAASLGAALSSPRLSGVGALLGPANGRRLVSLGGSLYLHADVLGVRLRAHAGGFFQGNRFLVEALARAVGGLLPKGGALLDLYGGVGLFALTAGREADSVSIVEGSELSAADAEENARTAGLPDVRVLPGEVGEVLARLRSPGDERIVVDPPRAGLARSVAAAIGERKPEVVVYVSCDPATLGRDLRTLASFGLEVDSVQALDMFPDTFHVESIARLVRR
jgi:23S rRNA (uracil1939-C5)-methyltransferase